MAKFLFLTNSSRVATFTGSRSSMLKWPCVTAMSQKRLVTLILTPLPIYCAPLGRTL